jgi:transposase
MEDVLELYAKSYDPAYPVVCLDERPVQLLSHVTAPLPAKPRYQRHFDYEYQREGTCNLFMFFQPLAGWHMVKVTAQRKKQDFAHCLRDLVDLYFPAAKCIQVMLDKLNTHTFAALYETFSPAEAQRIMAKLDLHFTPKHGSWLNMVELELSVLSRQLLKRRIASQERLRAELAAWCTQRNAARATVNWRITVDQARRKLSNLYPP